MASATGKGDSFGAAFRAALGSAGLGPLTSYNAKSAAAQYKHLTKTAAGRQALADAGLTAAPQTRRRWLGGRQKPNKANTAVIGEIYAAIARGHRQIPSAIKTRKMHITGRLGTGSDIRDRGSTGHAPVEVDLSHGDWTRLDQIWDSDLVGDFELDDLLSEDLIEPDIGGSDTWFFPGQSYTVKFTF